MIFRPKKERIRRTRDYKKILFPFIYITIGIACFLLGFFSATPILSLFR